MRETEEQIQVMLATAGEPIYFDNVTLQGIPGELTSNVASFDSPYDVDRQEYSFMLSGKDFLDNSIAPDASFIYKLNNRDYTFSILRYVDDLTGWFHLYVDLLQVVPNV